MYMYIYIYIYCFICLPAAGAPSSSTSAATQNIMLYYTILHYIIIVLCYFTQYQYTISYHIILQIILCICIYIYSYTISYYSIVQYSISYYTIVWYGMSYVVCLVFMRCSLLDLCVSSLRRGHANLLCIVPILTDDPRRESRISYVVVLVFTRCYCSVVQVCLFYCMMQTIMYDMIIVYHIRSYNTIRSVFIISNHKSSN